MEQELEITQNGDFKNIYLKTMYKKQGGKFVVENGKKVVDKQGLEDGNHILVKKKFPEGRLIKTGPTNPKTGKPTYLLYSVLVTYGDTDVSFMLFEDDYHAFNACGGVDDTVKIELNKEAYVNTKTGMEGVKEQLNFSKVE